MPKYTLKYPLKSGPSKEPDAIAQYKLEEFTAITFREMTIEDMLGSDAIDGEQHTRLYYMHTLSGIPERVLKRMEIADWNGATRTVLKLVSAGNATD